MHTRHLAPPVSSAHRELDSTSPLAFHSFRAVAARAPVALRQHDPSPQCFSDRPLKGLLPSPERLPITLTRTTSPLDLTIYIRDLELMN